MEENLVEEDEILTVEDVITDSKYYEDAKFYLFIFLINLVPLFALPKEGTLREAILMVLFYSLLISLVLKNAIPVIQMYNRKFWIEKRFVKEQHYSLVVTSEGKHFSKLYYTLTPNSECYFVRTKGFDIGFIDGKIKLEEDLKEKMVVTE